MKKLDGLLSCDYVNQSDFAKALDDFIITNCVISTEQSHIVLRQIQGIIGKPLAKTSTNVDLVEEIEEAKEEA
jgi:uncharacterized protein YeeX (DUF496 family)